MAEVDSTAASAPDLSIAATVTSHEIAAALGIIKRNVERRAEKERWAYQEELVRGGRRRRYLVAGLPIDVRDALARGMITATLPALVPAEATPPACASASAVTTRAAPSLHEQDRLSDWQRECRDARKALLDEIRRCAATVGLNRAIENVIALAGRGELPAELQVRVAQANARRGRDGKRTLSRGRVMAWLADHRKGGINALAPRGRGRDYVLTDELATVLAQYRKPNKPALLWCVKAVARERGLTDYRPLYHRALRYVGKLPQAVFHRGRHTGAALKALQPFRRRDFLSLAVNDVWVGDGHACKFRVAHPDTGSPFVPEVTLIMDWGQRYIVGWSASLSENCIAVSDALRHAVENHGIPLIYYSDGGSGQTAKMLDAPVTGILGALDIRHEVGRPGNPQARGVIERLWQTLTIPLAREFPTYQGRGADRDTLREVTRTIDKQLRIARAAATRGEVVALPAKLPSWSQFLDAMERAIADYNTGHRHTSLPKLDGVHHATPAEFRAARMAELGTQIDRPSPEQVRDLFRPSALRIAARGEVRLWNGIYYHPDLMLVDGEQVRVHYDVHQVETVIVRRASGEFIAEARLGGNRSGVFPQPLIERERQERAKRRRGLLESKIAEVEAELGGRTVAIGEPDSAVDHEALAAEIAAGAVTRREEAADEWAPYRRCRSIEARLAAGADVDDEDAAWCVVYKGSADYLTFDSLAQDFPEKVREPNAETSDH
ncbi:MAG: transposase [Burkholderiales bacterium]|nr:transposase [Burkholderiales bacterium]